MDRLLSYVSLAPSDRFASELALHMPEELSLNLVDDFLELLVACPYSFHPTIYNHVEMLSSPTPQSLFQKRSSVVRMIQRLTDDWLSPSITGPHATSIAAFLARVCRSGYVDCFDVQSMGKISTVVKQAVAYLKSNDVDGDGRISSAEYKRAESWSSICDFVTLTELVRELAQHRGHSLSLIRANVPNLLVEIVSRVVDFRKEEIQHMLHILWSVLEHSLHRQRYETVAITRMQLLDKFRTGNALFRLGNVEAITMLSSLMERMLHEGYRLQDKQLRNEVLIISTLLATRQANGKIFLETGYLSLLLLYANATENQLPTGCNARHYATTHPLDLEFKLLLWQVLSKLADVSKTVCLPVINDSLFVKTLLSYLTSRTDFTPLQPSQLRVVRLHALNTLARLRPFGAHAEVAKFLDRYVENDDELIEAALQVLLNCEDVHDSVEAGMLLRFIHPRHAENAALVLATRVSADAFREAGGIAIISNELLLTSHQKESLAVAGLACIQHCVLGNNHSETEFIDNCDGIDKLLTLVDEGSLGLQGQALATLSDILNQNPDARPYVLHWKSPISHLDVASIVLDLWKEEALVTVQDPMQPLQPGREEKPIVRSKLEQARSDAQNFMIPKCQRQILLQVEFDIRDRIASFLSSIDDDIGSIRRRLDFRQQSVLLLAEHLASFRKGEAWVRLNRDTIPEELPIHSDRVFIEDKLENLRNLALQVKERQEQLGKQDQEKQDEEDQTFYDEINSKRLKLIDDQRKAASIQNVRRRRNQRKASMID